MRGTRLSSSLPAAPRRGAALVLGVCWLWLCACDATVVEGARISLGDTASAGDGGAADLAPALDGDATSGGATGTTGVFARGTFSGVDGHIGRGGAALLRTGGGAIALRLSADFSASQVPGPVVVLSRSETLGSSISAARGDLLLGALKAASGAQSYALSGGDGGRRYAWVYCKPFGVGIARAKLEDVP